jgi:hypothetical protein
MPKYHGASRRRMNRGIMLQFFIKPPKLERARRTLTVKSECTQLRAMNYWEKSCTQKYCDKSFRRLRNWGPEHSSSEGSRLCRSRLFVSRETLNCNKSVAVLSCTSACRPSSSILKLIYRKSFLSSLFGFGWPKLGRAAPANYCGSPIFKK